MKNELKTRTHKNYTKDDESYLRLHYKDIPTQDIAKHLNKTVESITSKAWRMKLVKESHHWTSNKLVFLEENFSIIGYKGLAKHFGVTESTIRKVYNKYCRLDYTPRQRLSEYKKKQKVVAKQLIEPEPLAFKTEIDEVLHEIKVSENSYGIFKR